MMLERVILGPVDDSAVGLFQDCHKTFTRDSSKIVPVGCGIALFADSASRIMGHACASHINDITRAVIREVSAYPPAPACPALARGEPVDGSSSGLEQARQGRAFKPLKERRRMRRGWRMKQLQHSTNDSSNRRYCRSRRCCCRFCHLITFSSRRSR